jgi:hypothetical protein
MAGRCAARAGGALLHTCYLLWQGDALPVLVVLSFGASTGYLGCTCPYSWAAKVAPPTDRQAGRQDLGCPSATGTWPSVGSRFAHVRMCSWRACAGNAPSAFGMLLRPSDAAVRRCSARARRPPCGTCNMHMHMFMCAHVHVCCAVLTLRSSLAGLLLAAEAETLLTTYYLLLTTYYLLLTTYYLLLTTYYLQACYSRQRPRPREGRASGLASSRPSPSWWVSVWARPAACSFRRPSPPPPNWWFNVTAHYIRGGFRRAGEKWRIAPDLPRPQ